MAKYILAIDQSTTATKAILFDEQAGLVGRSDATHKQIYPNHGWVEHDPVEIYDNTIRVIKDVITANDIEKSEIAVIAITNQRETTMLWDKNGQPAYNAIVWQCNRGTEIIRQAGIVEHAKYIQDATGITLSPFFSSAKAKWICDNVQVADGTLFGTMDSWLVWKLTGNHATDYSNASRTQLFNLGENKWDKRIIDTFGIGGLEFPDIKSSNDIFGYTTAEGFFDDPVPVSGVMGDSHGALFGQKCFKPGEGKATFGTGTSIMVNIGDQPKKSQNGLVTSIAWALNGKVEYVFEGNINSSGDTVKWLVEGLGIINSAKESEAMARNVEDTGGVYLVPAFHGLGAPHWDYDCRGLVCGIRRDTNKNHIVRAGLESIAYQIRDIFESMSKDLGERVKLLKVDGGATNNHFLMQFVADMLGTKIQTGNIEELSAMGAAYAAGIAVGIWEDKNALPKKTNELRAYHTQMKREMADVLYGGWKQAVSQCRCKH